MRPIDPRLKAMRTVRARRAEAEKQKEIGRQEEEARLAVLAEAAEEAERHKGRKAKLAENKRLSDFRREQRKERPKEAASVGWTPPPPAVAPHMKKRTVRRSIVMSPEEWRTIQAYVYDNGYQFSPWVRRLMYRAMGLPIPKRRAPKNP